MTLLEKIKNDERTILSPAISDLLDVDRFFGRNNFRSGLTANIPSANIMENNSKYLIELAAPGFTKTDFQVHLNGDLLTISAEKELDDEQHFNKYNRREFNFDNFKRSFRIPNTIARENIKAIYENGILSVSLNKKEEAIKKPSIEIPIS